LFFRRGRMDLSSIRDDEMEGYKRSMLSRKKEVVRKIEKLVNEELKMNDVVVRKGGIVKKIGRDDGIIVVAEW